MRVVGTNHGGYANERNISGLPMQRHRVVRATNLYRLPNYIYFKLRGKLHHFMPHAHWDGGLGNCDLLHFFNGVSSGRRPWLSTFETYLPRWVAYGGGRLEWGLKQLAKPACKRLIALSQCTADIQHSFLADHPKYADEILSKVVVMHPPQAPTLSELEVGAKHSGILSGVESWQLAFVGADFFRKGGLEVLQAVELLLKEGWPICLKIVSAMNHGDYASHATKADLDKAMQIIQRWPRNIFHHRQLPYSEVLTICKEAHVGLLPTWADTYGYSALEFMAGGAPVLCTDIRALPEIVGTDRGWLLPMPKDHWGNGVLHSSQDRHDFSSRLLSLLIETLPEVLGSPQAIVERGRAAYGHILDAHSPTAAAARLEGWYDAALSE